MKSGEFEELTQLLFNNLTQSLAEFGFSPSPKDQLFSLRKHNTRFAIHLTYIPHEIDFDVTVDVAVRFDDLEDLVNENNDHLSPSQKRKTFSIGAELGNIQRGKQLFWTIENLGDILTNVPLITSAISQIGFKYFEDFSKLEHVFLALNDDDNGWVHSPVLSERVRRALGLAYLIGDRNEFTNVATEKRKLLETICPSDVASFENFKEYLLSRWNSKTLYI